MEKRYQIFVSSTFTDLKEERQAVMQALLTLEHFPAGMELFPASDEDQLALIKGVIDDSDYYVLVVGGRYGSTNERGISFTELEFDYATETGKPILAFLHESPGDIPQAKADETDALRAHLRSFIEKVKKSGRHVKFWSSPADLMAKVIAAISAETKRNPREGWVRASRVSDPLAMEALRQEIDRLNVALSSASTEPPTDAAIYAGGNDSYSVAFDGHERGSAAEVYQEHDFTWDQIFREVAPTMMEEASESQMRRVLANELQLYDQSKFTKMHTITISNESFDTIKIQLLALGLIKKSDRRHVPSDRNRYWTLTPYGESLLMKLRAIRKKSKGS